MIVNAGSAVIDGELKSSVSLEIHDGIITEISGLHGTPDLTIDGALLPGFVDMHCHGGAGFSFSSKSTSEIDSILALHQLHGTTTQLASLVTEPIAELKEQIRFLTPFVHSGRIAGIHLEGPYLSHEKCGAHNPALLRHPDIAEIADLLEAGQGAITMVTIAPELPGAIAAIEYLANEGVIVAIGHSAANAQVTKEAIDAGATVVTHFYNGLPPLDEQIQNITSQALQDPSLTLELILDGIHVTEERASAILGLTPQRVALVTDAMSAAGSVDGKYQIGSLAVTVADGRATLDSTGSLAGSTLTLDHAFERLISTHKYSLPQAAHALSTLPARTLGINYAGEIAVGSVADFVEVNNGRFIKTHRL